MIFEHVKKANLYARRVVAKKIPACNYTILACQRHLDDLKKQKDKLYPFRFDQEKADRVCRFAEKMPHIKGKWAGSLITLSDWQRFILCSIFGWVKKSDDKRRFLEANVFVPRKNGKSVLGAVIGIYLFAIDGEAGSEVYSGATTEKQAWEVFGPARLMVQKTIPLQKKYGIEINAKTMTILANASKFEPVIGKPGDGPSPHGYIIDEYHEHLDSSMYDTAITGMGAREQPLCLIISTAGSDSSSPCKEKWDECEKILDGRSENDRTFAIIFGIDQDDDWAEIDNWKKANPNFGVSVSEEYLIARLQDAKNVASRQNIVKCKHLNVWASAGSAWINMQRWSKCAGTFSLSDFEGESCWIALDLASKIDLCVLTILFKRDDTYYLFCKHYMPEETIKLPQNRHYQKFLADGELIETPGVRTDFNYIIEDLRHINENFDIRQLGYDPKESNMLITEIDADPDFEFDCIEINQGPNNISEPMKEFEALYLSEKIIHENTAILNWQAGNVIQKHSIKTKAYYPSKNRNGDKIDAIVSAIMSLFLAIKDKGMEKSRFEEEDAEIFVI